MLRTERVGGQPLDVGAEAFVARRPEVPALLAELGLADRQVAPAGARPLIYSGGRLHPLPAGTAQGIPAHAAVDGRSGRRRDARPDGRGAAAAVRLAAGRATRRSATWSATGSARRWSTRSVDPLLAGVYAGSAATIGMRAAVPTLAAALDRGARA